MVSVEDSGLFFASRVDLQAECAIMKTEVQCWIHMEDQLAWYNTHPRFVEDFVDSMTQFAPIEVVVSDGSGVLYLRCTYHIIFFESKFDFEQFPKGTCWAFDQVPKWVWRNMYSLSANIVDRNSNGSLRRHRGPFGGNQVYCSLCVNELGTHWFFCEKCRMKICRVCHLPRCLMMARADGLIPDVVGWICRRLIELTMLTDGQC